MDENWQKVQIPLDSVIDSNMADMLRPINDPALVFNRQVLQGGYLPTSVRFEKNGWFCGIYGYDYDTSSPGSVHDLEGLMPGMQVERRQTYVATAYLLESDDDAGDAVNFVYYPLTRVLTYASSKEPTMEWVPDDNGNLTIVKVSGKTHDFGNDYVFYIDMAPALDGDSDPQAAKEADWVLVDPEGVDFDFDGNPDLPNSMLFDQKRYVYSYTVYDRDQSFTDELVLNYALPFYIGSEVHEMSFDGKTFSYGDNNILTATFDDWPVGATVEVSSPSIDIAAACSVMDPSTNCACAVDIEGSICLEVADNLTALTETYYTDLSLKECLCTNQSSIGKASTATVLQDGESVQVPLVAAGFVCLGTACPYESCNVMETGCNVYAECITGAVPVWSAQTIWLLRFFGDDIFEGGQNAAQSGIVATFVPQQSFVAGAGVDCGAGDINFDGMNDPACCACEWYGCGCCANCAVEYSVIDCACYKQFYCTVYGNCQYSWVDSLSKSHPFSSCGRFYIGSVNQCSACANYRQCVSFCVPLWYMETGQSVDTHVCVLLDAMCGNMQVQSVGCTVSITADPMGFSTGSFSNCHPFAPLPGSVPQFIVHTPYCVKALHNGPWSKCMVDCVLGCINAICSDNTNTSFSVACFLSRNNCCLYNYWNGNGFYANVQITPVTVVYPTAGWFQSYVSFKGLKSPTCVDRSCLDNPDSTMICIDTPYCSKGTSLKCCLELVRTFDSTCCFDVPDNFALGGRIVIQSSNGQDGCPGEDSWWCRRSGGNELDVYYGAPGKGGDSGVGFCVDVCYPIYDPVTCTESGCICCTCYAPGGAGGGGGVPGILAAFPSSGCTELQRFSETWSQSGGPIDYNAAGQCVSTGNCGGVGGLGSTIVIDLPPSGKKYWNNCCCCCCCSESHVYFDIKSCVNLGCAACGIGRNFTSRWQEAAGFWSSPSLCPNQCNIGGNGADSSFCYNTGDCHQASATAVSCVSHYNSDGALSETVDIDCASAEISCCFNTTICYAPGCSGCGSVIDCASNNTSASVSLYRWVCCTDWNYDVANLQNEENCFGIHLCCNCIRLSNLLMCCSTDCCIEARAVELVPYLSDGYIYIASTIDAKPAWSTSLALTYKDFWKENQPDNYVSQFCGEYVGRDMLIEIPTVFEDGVCLVVQSSSGCNGRTNCGGDSGYGVCVSGCYKDDDCCTYPFEIIVAGGAGGGGGGLGGLGATWRNGPYMYSCRDGYNGSNGAGAPGHCYTCVFMNCCVWDLKICICCTTAAGINGANSPFCYDDVCCGGNGGWGENGCPGDCRWWFCRQPTCGCPGGVGGCGWNSPGVEVSTTDCFVRLFAIEKITGAEPWSMSNDTAVATRLGGACGMSPQMQLPLTLNYIDRLVDVTVSSSHESCYNLVALAGVCASDTNVTFCGKNPDCPGCYVCYCSAADWTRDTGIVNGCYVCPFVAILHGCRFGDCAFDYGVYYDVTNKCLVSQAYDSSKQPISSLCNFNYSQGRMDLGGYSGCSDHAQIGYTTNTPSTCFTVCFDNNNTVTEPYLRAVWSGQYAFCTRLALPNVVNCCDCGCGSGRDGHVVSFAKGVYAISYNCGTDMIAYNECQQSVGSGIYAVSVTENCATEANYPGKACLCVCGADFDCGTFTLRGVYKNKGTEELNLKCIDNDYLTFQYADNCCLSRVCVQNILDNKTFLDITATNVNQSVHCADGTDNTNETKIASIEMNSEYQIVKQKWDTTIETENIWWLDDEHMMELTADKLVVYSKQYDPETGEAILDDWAGDKWAVEREWMRSDFIDSTVIRYGVSSVYGDTAMGNHGALFWTMNVLDSVHFRLNVFLPLGQMVRAFAHVFTIKELNYGEDLPTAVDEIGMYTSMDAHAILSQAEVSATNVGWHFIIGVHVDNCLKQWSFVFSAKTWQLQRKITGYGYVAPNGSLTGGQFPEQNVDQTYGFKGRVNFINSLADYHNQSVDGAFTMSGVYGTQEQQWYLYKSVKKICSHFMFSEHADIKNNGNSVPLVCKWLPLQSNYSAVYSSPSFMLNRLTGFLPVPTTLGSIFDFGVGAIDTLVDVLTAIASPSIWFLNICWIKFGFLQQTIGQYAYTYKTTDKDIDVDKNNIDINALSQESQNSDNPMQDLLDAYKNNSSVLARDSLSFDKQEFSQTCTTKSSSNEGVSNFWLALLQAGIGGLNSAAMLTKPTANEAVNKTTPGDKAKIFSQFAVENALNVAAAGFGANATDNVMLASKVTAVKTLDMFYSTSSNSNMYAGPGYVCHNVIGYCVAQSMANRLVAGTQSSMFTALSFLSSLSYALKNVILQSMSNLFEKLAESTKGSGSYALGSGFTWGDIAAAIMRSGQFVTNRLIDMNNFFLEMLPELLRAVCPDFPNPKFNLVPGLSQHDIDIEAKHYYGSKHCLFMWPCFGCESTYFTKESVKAVVKDVAVKIDFTPQNNGIVKSGQGYRTMYTQPIDFVTDNSNDSFKKSLYDNVHSHYAYAQGMSEIDNVPPDTAVVEGTSSFLPTVPFKNENIDVDSAFTIAPIQDYMIDSEWQIGKTAGPTGVLWTTVKDTKIIDGDTSNIIVTDSSALVASPYVAIEVKKQIETDYIRPVAVTPNALAWNMTGLNVSYDSEMKHGFDGVGYRLVHWAGSSGMGTEYLTLEYCFFDNDHFKRSNKLQPNRFWGSFSSLPTVANKADFNDSLYHQFEIDAKGIGTEQLTASENKNTMRNAIPLFTEQLSTMPAVVKALSSYRLDVISGVTSLTTQGRTTQSSYKVPKSIDFNINKHLYRATEEYVNELNDQGLAVGEVVAKMGLEFIGATPTQAFFYSEATRAYYSFVGANTITKQDVWNRFKDIRDGKWDFVNQNVVFQCIGNMSRLMDNADDNDSNLIDNIFIATMSGEQPGITGEITPPNTAVFDNESWFKTYSFSGGVAFQGPNRYIVNRFIVLDYMIDDIVANKGKWKKVPRNVFDPYRKYNEEFKAVNDRIGDSNDYTYTKAAAWDSNATYYYKNDEGKWKRAYALTEAQFLLGDYYTRTLTPVVEGWTHNPFLLATAPLGVDEDTDCMFEWQLTFTWTDEMDKLYSQNDYVCVNIMAQTMCPGGKKRSEPTHLFLHKGLFTRGDNSGYYSFKYSSRNGAGNREQLFIWSDGYIAMTGLSLSYKAVTSRRTSPLAVEQNDIQEMSEF